MTIVLSVLIVLSALAMIAIVLVQKSKGGGLASGFSSSNSILGYKKTTDTVEKATWILAGTIMVLSIITVIVSPKAYVDNSAVKAIETQQELPADFDNNNNLQLPQGDNQ